MQLDIVSTMELVEYTADICTAYWRDYGYNEMVQSAVFHQLTGMCQALRALGIKVLVLTQEEEKRLVARWEKLPTL